MAPEVKKTIEGLEGIPGQAEATLRALYYKAIDENDLASVGNLASKLLQIKKLQEMWGSQIQVLMGLAEEYGISDVVINEGDSPPTPSASRPKTEVRTPRHPKPKMEEQAQGEDPTTEGGISESRDRLRFIMECIELSGDNKQSPQNPNNVFKFKNPTLEKAIEKALKSKGKLSSTAVASEKTRLLGAKANLSQAILAVVASNPGAHTMRDVVLIGGRGTEDSNWKQLYGYIAIHYGQMSPVDFLRDISGRFDPKHGRSFPEDLASVAKRCGVEAGLPFKVVNLLKEGGHPIPLSRTGYERLVTAIEATKQGRDRIQAKTVVVQYLTLLQTETRERTELVSGPRATEIAPETEIILAGWLLRKQDEMLKLMPGDTSAQVFDSLCQSIGLGKSFKDALEKGRLTKCQERQRRLNPSPGKMKDEEVECALTAQETERAREQVRAVVLRLSKSARGWSDKQIPQDYSALRLFVAITRAVKAAYGDSPKASEKLIELADILVKPATHSFTVTPDRRVVDIK